MGTLNSTCAHKKNPCRWAGATRVLGTVQENWTDRNGKSSLARSGIARLGSDSHQLGPQRAFWMRRSLSSKDRTRDGKVNTIIDQFPFRTVRWVETKFSFLQKEKRNPRNRSIRNEQTSSAKVNDGLDLSTISENNGRQREADRRVKGRTTSRVKRPVVRPCRPPYEWMRDRKSITRWQHFNHSRLQEASK